MKKAEEYLKEFDTTQYPESYKTYDILKAIKQAQIDAIEETARIISEDPFNGYVNTEPIAKQLKKEIENGNN